MDLNMKLPIHCHYLTLLHGTPESPMKLDSISDSCLWYMMSVFFFFDFRASILVILQLHSIFLHMRKVRRMAGVREAKSGIVKAEWVLNWITFTLARFISHILITVKLIKDASKFGKGVELPLALFGMAGMNFLNVFLGIDLFNAYRRENNPQKNSHKHGE